MPAMTISISQEVMEKLFRKCAPIPQIKGFEKPLPTMTKSRANGIRSMYGEAEGERLIRDYEALRAHRIEHRKRLSFSAQVSKMLEYAVAHMPESEVHGAPQIKLDIVLTAMVNGTKLPSLRDLLLSRGRLGENPPPQPPAAKTSRRKKIEQAIQDHT